MRPIDRSATRCGSRECVDRPFLEKDIFTRADSCTGEAIDIVASRPIIGPLIGVIVGLTCLESIHARDLIRTLLSLTVYISLHFCTKRYRDAAV